MKNLCIALLLVTTSLTFAQKAKPKTTPKATTGALATFENLKAEIITEGGKQKLAIVMDNAGKKENVILKDITTKDMAQKPSIPKGTRDFTPQEMANRNYIFNTIKDVFRLYGFQQIETPAKEKVDWTDMKNNHDTLAEKGKLL
jgi:hypothetical protein